MANLMIRVYADGKTEPDVTVTIPLSVLNVAAKLVPKDASAEMKKAGIDLREIVELSRNPEVRGILLEVENHAENKRIVVAIE